MILRVTCPLNRNTQLFLARKSLFLRSHKSSTNKMCQKTLNMFWIYRSAERYSYRLRSILSLQPTNYLTFPKIIRIKYKNKLFWPAQDQWSQDQCNLSPDIAMIAFIFTWINPEWFEMNLNRLWLWSSANTTGSHLIHSFRYLIFSLILPPLGPCMYVSN